MNLKILAKELEKELDIPADIIEKIARSEFKMLEETIREGKMKNVYLRFIGRFGVNPARVSHFPEEKQDYYYGKRE